MTANILIKHLLIEGKQSVFDRLKAIAVKWAEEMREYKNEPGNDEEDKRVVQGKEDVLWDLIEEFNNDFEMHISEINERFPEQCSDTSTEYGKAGLPGWTQNFC